MAEQGGAALAKKTPTLEGFFQPKPAVKREAQKSDSDYLGSDGGSDGSDGGSDSDFSAEAAAAVQAPLRKRPREDAAAPPSAHTRDTLSQLSHAALIDVAVELANRVKSLEAAQRLPAAAAAEAPLNAPAAKALSAEAVAAQVAKVCAVANKGIRSQLKWKQSCKAGTAKWSYDGLCSSAVAVAILKGYLSAKEERLLADTTERKAVAKKLTLDAFTTIFGHVSASIRYGSLGVTGSTVTVRFDNSSGELKVSGTYGV